MKIRNLVLAALVAGTLAQAGDDLYGQRGDFGSCRSTVTWNENQLAGAKNLLGRWISYAEEDLKGYKDGTVKYNNVNHMWAIQQLIKDRNYSPKTFNRRQWMTHVRKIFIRDCGGFLKKDQDIALKTVKARIFQWRIAEQMMTNRYFVKNWKTIGAYFPGYYDYRTPTGYAIP